jgi:hypothetical protein
MKVTNNVPKPESFMSPFEALSYSLFLDPWSNDSSPSVLYLSGHSIFDT